MPVDNKVQVDINSSRINPLQMLKLALSELFIYKDLIRELVILELRAVYKKSFLGAFWVIFAPLFQVLIWLMLQLTGILNPGETGVPYPLYVFFSISLWLVFKGAYETTSNTLVQKGSLLLSNKLTPRVLVFSRILVHLFQTLIPIVASLVILLAIGYKPSFSVLFFPVFLIPLLVFGIAIGLVIALIRVVLIDFSNLFDRAIDLLMFVSPVIFSKQIDHGFLKTIMKWNPITYLIEYPRSLVFDGWSAPDQGFVFCSCGILLLFLISFSFFNNRYYRVLEKLIG